ncbi:DUF5666 domain-containing protein [Nocardia brasiliensis]|uniref:DUF5666 domain-containing protein n=1 Tax=Nocardia brasiliensis TaxID=37326 RepID=UPI002456C94E|nr:DUF5666 domain-containing protein [Nocardia brasiliensis]
MTNPNDPWGQRPEDAPTEHLAGKSGFEQPLHTTEYSEAYGSGAPSAYPATEQFEPWSPPPPNATREFPPADNQWGGYESTYGNQWAAAPVDAPPGGPVPPGLGMPPEPPKRNTGLWIALIAGVVLLVGAAGVVAGVVLSGKDSDSSTAANTSALPTANRTPVSPRTGQPNPTVLPSLPGLPGIDALGTTMGTITANDGGTLTVSTLTNATVTVHTDANTQVISVSGTKVADLPKGDIVLIQGDKGADGTIHAKVIISTSLPGGPR